MYLNQSNASSFNLIKSLIEVGKQTKWLFSRNNDYKLNNYPISGGIVLIWLWAKFKYTKLASNWQIESGKY
jgi:hypothetical protein